MGSSLSQGAWWHHSLPGAQTEALTLSDIYTATNMYSDEGPPLNHSKVAASWPLQWVENRLFPRHQDRCLPLENSRATSYSSHGGQEDKGLRERSGQIPQFPGKFKCPDFLGKVLGFKCY